MSRTLTPTRQANRANGKNSVAAWLILPKVPNTASTTIIVIPLPVSPLCLKPLWETDEGNLSHAVPRGELNLTS